MSFDVPTRDAPYFVRSTDQKPHYAAIRLVDYSAYDKLYRAEFEDGFRLWFSAAQIYSDNVGTLANFDPAFHEKEAAAQAGLIKLMGGAA